MITNRKQLQKVLAILRRGVITNNNALLDPGQAQLVKDLLEVREGRRYERPQRCLCRKLMEHNPLPKNRLRNCRNCAFWYDTGRLASYGPCYRMVLAYNDMLTPVEHVVPGEPADLFFTPEDFVCTWYLEREGGEMAELGLNSDQTRRTNKALDELFGFGKFLYYPAEGEEGQHGEENDW